MGFFDVKGNFALMQLQKTCFSMFCSHYDSVEKSLKFVISCLLETSFSKILPEKHLSNVFRKKAVQIFDRYLNTQKQSPGRVI